MAFFHHEENGVLCDLFPYQSPALVKSFNLSISCKAELAARPGLEFGVVAMYYALL